MLNMYFHQVAGVSVTVTSVTDILAFGLGAFTVREGVKKTRLFRGHVPYQGGGSRPPPAKIFFLQTICKKYAACPEKPFLLKPFLCIVNLV